jgi:hypothetical protein
LLEKRQAAEESTTAEADLDLFCITASADEADLIYLFCLFFSSFLLLSCMAFAPFGTESL